MNNGTQCPRSWRNKNLRWFSLLFISAQLFVSAFPNPVPLNLLSPSSPISSSSSPQQYLSQFIVGQNSAFNIQFVCESASTNSGANASGPSTGSSFCQKAERTFQNAAERITRVLKIDSTINVYLKMFLPCGKTFLDASCSQNSLLGWALPAQRIPIQFKSNSEIYLYPTALLKQTDMDLSKLSLYKYDIVAQFNAQKEWWFREDGTQLAENQRDLEMVALHELIHGLGFGDDTIMTNHFLRDNKHLFPYFESQVSPGGPLFNVDQVQPQTQGQQQVQDEIKQNGKDFYQWSYPSIWNRFTVYREPASPSSTDFKPLTELHHQYISAIEKEIYPSLALSSASALSPPPPYTSLSTSKQPIPSSELFSFIMRSPKLESLSSKMYQISTTNLSVYFSLAPSTSSSVNDENLIPLETSIQPYNDGSSLVHISMTRYSTTDDGLMVWRVPKSLPAFSAGSGGNNDPNGNGSGVGKTVVKMLVKMGYKAVSPEDGEESWKIRDTARIYIPGFENGDSGVPSGAVGISCRDSWVGMGQTWLLVIFGSIVMTGLL